jgi:hypothetical protein
MDFGLELWKGRMCRSYLQFVFEFTAGVECRDHLFKSFRCTVEAHSMILRRTNFLNIRRKSCLPVSQRLGKDVGQIFFRVPLGCTAERK